jgi:hypothetical protein
VDLEIEVGLHDDAIDEQSNETPPRLEICTVEALLYLMHELREVVTKRAASLFIS